MESTQKLVSEAQVALHLFVQWHLHLQLHAAVEHTHAQGLALKGDLPIGVYRHSADAWVSPEPGVWLVVKRVLPGRW